MRPSFSGLVLLITLCFVTGCDRASTAKKESPVDEKTLLAKLQAADLLDGNEDHIVSKCYICGLAMDGKAEHAADYRGYKIYCCSPHCRDYFQAKADSIVATTELPAAEAAK